MSKMRVVQVARPSGPFELVEREIPEAGTTSVRIKISACGICQAIPIRGIGAIASGREHGDESKVISNKLENKRSKEREKEGHSTTVSIRSTQEQVDVKGRRQLPAFSRHELLSTGPQWTSTNF
jgi:hypothetical protein